MFSLFCKMGSAPSHSGYTNPETKVYQAARDGITADLTDVLKRLSISKRNTALETKTKDGDHFTTPLIIAALNGNLDSVKMLLKYKAHIEARGTVKVDDQVFEGCTPLWAAAATGYLDVVKLLIEENADVDGRTLTNSTPLRAAAYDGRLDIVSCLVENGADVNARNNFENTPLMVACYNGHMNVAIYLIKHGANINLQDHIGMTALHFAMERGHLEIGDKLLANGALQLQTNRRLTPLLSASNACKIEMVEYFIKRPECTKEQRINALELLGATIANEPKVYDIKKAFFYMKRGMEERFEDLSHPLLKKKMEPLGAYEKRKESQTLEELALLESDDHAIHMEGLIIRERILGTDNSKLCHPIRYRGAFLADFCMFDSCIALWRHAMEISQHCNEPVTRDLEDFAGLLGDMLSRKRLLSPEFMEEIFEKLVLEYERLTEKLQSGKLEMKFKEANTIEEELEELIYCGLNLLMLYTKVQVPEIKEYAGRLELIQRFICLDPRTRNGDTLLHLAACSNTPIKDFHILSVCKLPCVATMRLLLLAGLDVNAVNPKGDTPLHVAVTFKPSPREIDTLRDMLELLLDTGADKTLENAYGQTAMDYCATDEARRILSEKVGVNVDMRAVRKFEVLTHCSLKNA